MIELRDFICGRETLLSCIGELLGLTLVLAFFALVGVILIAGWWRGRRR